MARRGSRDFAKLARKIERAGRNVEAAAVSGLRVIGELILTDVNASSPGHGVPRDEGILAGSARAVGPDAKGTVTLSYGGASAPYALRQHEDLTLWHPVGEARYLVRGMERFELDGSAAEKALERNVEAGLRAAARG